MKEILANHVKLNVHKTKVRLRGKLAHFEAKRN